MNIIRKWATTTRCTWNKISFVEIKEKLKDVAIKAATAMMTAVLLLALYWIAGLMLLFMLMLQ